MIPHIRKQFNEQFRPEAYEAFMKALEHTFGEAPTFKVAETPVFVPRELGRKLEQACKDISEFLLRPDFKSLTHRAIPLPALLVPNEDEHPLFLQFDFAISQDENGVLSPHLIELQGFPSLFFYQHLLAINYRRYFHVPAELDHLFGGLNLVSYVKLLREVIVGEHHPRNVILLEIEPGKQNTRIDFWGAQEVLGIKILCLSDLKRDGRDLYYLDEQGRSIAVHRIFNRVIFDELMQRPDLVRDFNLTEEVDVEWAGHPNWFMRISKYTMPFLQHPSVPQTFFLDQMEYYPDDLENYVLKPLFSFSGKGVKINVTKQDLDAVKDPSNYILQRKVTYSPVIKAPGDLPDSKCELRMMMIWKPGWDRPQPAINLVRITRGEMVGVRYNSDDRWVGASIGFFEPL